MEKEIRKEICELLIKEDELRTELNEIMAKEKTVIKEAFIGKCFTRSTGTYEGIYVHLFKEFKSPNECKGEIEPKLSFITVRNYQYEYKICEEEETLREILNWFRHCKMREYSYEEFMLHFTNVEKAILTKIQQNCKELQTNTEEKK